MGTEGKVGEKILVVDDEPEVRRVLSEFLESRGYQPVTASSGVEALSRVEEEEGLRLVLLDIRMPGMDGIETLRRIRQTNPSLPVLMVTAIMDEETARNALALGAYDYITKPFDLGRLDLTIMMKLLQQG